ncbi:MAG: 30S ribosome-binding factor RbfA [Armatimonadetes bacterium]|nr:30S ribosome-binding factor RbfA [Armatimonadota bacterium]
MNTRLERVGQLIRDEVADILRRDIHDPLIGFVTLTEVEVSPDLRHGKVFFSVLGTPEQVQDSIKGILRARKHINALLADRIDLRYIPKLRFVYDETAAKAQRMQQLLQHEQEVLGPDLERHAAEAQASDAVEPDASGATDASDEDFGGSFDDEFDDEDFGDDEAGAEGEAPEGG